MPVSDATPLIYLAKIGKLHLLKEIFNQIQIPPEVKKETVDRGKEKGYPDAIPIEQALNDGWILTDTLTEDSLKTSEALTQVTGIDIGEAQTITLAKQKKERQVLIDQANARETAKRLNLTPKGTIYIIITAAKRQLLTKKEAKQTLDNLIDANFHISVEIYRDALKTIEKL